MSYLQLKLVSKGIIDQSNQCQFTEQGGSIGRSSECDWTLPDTERYISNKHALISFSHQQFIITDVSSNGLLINNSKSPLGKNNQHVLKLSDSITIGEYCIQVESIELDKSPVVSDPSSNDLLNLVMGGEEKVSSKDEFSPLSNTPINSDFNVANPSDGGLGLNEILSGPANPVTSYGSSSFVSEKKHDDNELNISPSFNKPLASPEFTQDNQHYVANDSSIPEDWELSGIMPAIEDYKSPNENGSLLGSNDASKKQSKGPTNIEVQALNESLEGTNFQTEAQENELAAVENSKHQQLISGEIDDLAKLKNKDQNSDIENKTSNPREIPNENNNEPTDNINKNSSVKPSSNITDEPSVKSENEPMQANQDVFFINLYNKLGLPKEYISTIDTDVFADDIVSILLSTTKGLMTLLNSRTAFKQESRLSLTSVQPRSNNPIKFSIDPVDTLEMLMLKKKKGYMSTKDSYEEAVYDIQLHQMAFLTGLQATLEGVLGQLNPDIIEKQIAEKGRSFMGINSNAQYWQLYKERQLLLLKSVKENLNEVLSNHFSEAYQAQINKFKNE